MTPHEVTQKYAKRQRGGRRTIVYCKPNAIPQSDPAWGKVIIPLDVAAEAAEAMTEASGRPMYHYSCPYGRHAHLTRIPPSVRIGRKTPSGAPA